MIRSEAATIENDERGGGVKNGRHDIEALQLIEPFGVNHCVEH
jgi:hypothetical protein